MLQLHSPQQKLALALFPEAWATWAATSIAHQINSLFGCAVNRLSLSKFNSLINGIWLAGFSYSDVNVKHLTLNCVRTFIMEKMVAMETAKPAVACVIWYLLAHSSVYFVVLKCKKQNIRLLLLLMLRAHNDMITNWRQHDYNADNHDTQPSEEALNSLHQNGIS